jgi:hypothetical protein
MKPAPIPGLHALPAAFTPPKGVAWLGYGGLIPFVALAVASCLDGQHRAAWHMALLSYGAVILSFVGALHWAFAMTRGGDRDAIANEGQKPSTMGMYIWSVVPALAGWVALLLAQVMDAGRLWASLILMGGFALHYLKDRQLIQKLTLTRWYLPLRLQLTSVACLCLGLALLAPGISHAATPSGNATANTPSNAKASSSAASLPKQDFTVEIRQMDEGARGGKTYGTEPSRDLMETQQVQVRNGERASLLMNIATPVQWVQSVSAQEGKVKNALTWFQSGQTISLTPTWRGGKHPVLVDVDVQTASVQASPGGALPQQARSQVATSVSAALGEWVTIATSGNRAQRNTYSSEAATEKRVRLEMRVVVR